jgi:hypothetical protein
MEVNFGKVPRVYIETLKDNAISIMCKETIFNFLSKPMELPMSSKPK